MTDSLAARVLDLACTIQQIAAPTFHEQARARFVRDQFEALGLSDVQMDDIGNVYARRPGGPGRPLLLTAHTDTVFPADKPLALTRTPERVHGPGLGDNSLGVAGLFGVVWALGGEALPCDVWLAANVCEEGLGDLRGIRRVMERLGAQVKGTIVLEGMALGHIHHGGIGVRRYRFTVRAEGGHSWLNFGRPSAIHALMRLGAQIAEWSVPAIPKTTFNIGVIDGGTSVNTIAREASMDVDLRSEDAAQLADLIERVERLAAAPRQPGVHLELTVIGDRPSGAISREHPLVKCAAQALTELGYPPTFVQGSTDANLPLSQGRPGICIGLTTGGNAHRPDEYIDVPPLTAGVQALVTTVRRAARLDMS
jgi:acetylornithine deacetylase/succinyl-diaminopimelate desuccinylase-like protein